MAWAHIKSLKAAGKFVADMAPYPCHGHWHVGHSEKKLRKRIKHSLGKGRP